MYSGTTFTKYSGRVFGAHQKIDRVSRRHLAKLLHGSPGFPKINHILQFEGKNGPDGIKRKSPAKDEPWHFYQPFKNQDKAIYKYIQNHYDQLVKELKNNNQERAAFEAAWLAHTLVDGLTPAHHYPYEENLSALRGGQSIASRNTIREKLVMHGDTRREKIKNNWKMWGPRGLFTSHNFFELGVASLLKPLSFGDSVPTQSDIKRAKRIGPVELFQMAAREVGVLNMYDVYTHKGWTPKLAYQVRHKLGPTLVQTVTLVWFAAASEAGLASK